MSGDARGWRMALVPDALINPPEQARTALPDVLGVLEASGYGVLQRPSGYAVSRARGCTGADWLRCCDIGAWHSHLATSSARRSTPWPRVSGSPPSWPATICRQRSSAAGACSGLRAAHDPNAEGTREPHDMR